MKKLKYTLIALALGICSASAITLTVHKDTLKMLDFSIDWHDPLSTTNHYYISDISSVNLSWELYPSGTVEVPDFVLLDVFAVSPLFHYVDPYFPRVGLLYFLYQPYPSTFLGLYPGIDWEGRELNVKIAHDEQSARWTFHEKDYLPDPIQVPDIGNSAFLLMMGMATMLVFGMKEPE